MIFVDIGSYSFYIAALINLLYYLSIFLIKPNSNLLLTHHRIFTGFIAFAIITAFSCFVISFGLSDFSLQSVYANSHTHTDLIFKIGAAWSSHEGSMLLWLLIMSICNLLYTYRTNSTILSNAAKHIASFIQLIMHIFIIIIANPFIRTAGPIKEGLGFNPVLQDMALLIHPPILYLGYAATAMVFAITLSAAMNNVNNWWEEAKNWIIGPWIFLTAGIGLGSWWSYRELGWGGFWAWDPVENVALLPWFAGLTFIHLILIKKKNHLVNYLLKLNGILFFIFSLFATFVVRSGLISSIHAFATNNERGIYFLILLGFFAFYGMIIIAFYDSKNFNNIQQSWQDKVIFYGSLLIASGYLIIIFTIITPVYLNLSHGAILNIGEEFYQIIFGVILLPMLGLMNLVPLMSSKNSISLKAILIYLSLATIKIISIHHFLHIALLPAIILFLTLTLLLHYILTLFQKKSFNPITFLAHIGFCLIISGAIICTLFTISNEKYLDLENNTIIIKNYKVELTKIETIENDNYVGIKALFNLWQNNDELGKLQPELKFYKIEKMQLPDSVTFNHYFSDIYLLITNLSPDKDKLLVKIYYKPMISLIWIGCLLIVLSGFMMLGRNVHCKLKKLC